MSPALQVRDLPVCGNRVSFEVGVGEVLAVLGDNGAGKSLLLAYLSGHLRAPKGMVSVDGQPAGRVRRQIGVVFQHSGLIRNMTAYENVALPFLVHGLDLDGGLDQQVSLRMQLTGCGHLRDQDVHGLSEGDKQCVALSRALAGPVRLLVADEPVAALAPGKKALIEELLPNLVEQGALDAMVLATQDVPFALAVAHRLLILHEGGPTLIAAKKAAGNPAFIHFTNTSS